MGNTVLQRLEDLAGGVDRRATGCGAGTLPDIAARGFGLKMETPQDGASGQAVLLVDLENMVGQKARSSVLSSRMDALLACVDPYTPVVAACAGSRIGAESRRYLRERGVKLLVSDDGKDAADTMLLAEAQRLAQLGVRYFVVASGDRAFAKVADFGQLEVVLWKSQPPKKTNAYINRAYRVRRLERPVGLGQPQLVAAGQRPPEDERRAPQLSAQEGSGESVRSTTPDPAESVRVAGKPTEFGRRLRAVRGSALRGGAVFGAGILFGAGAAVGSRMTRAILGRSESAQQGLVADRIRRGRATLPALL